MHSHAAQHGLGTPPLSRGNANLSIQPTAPSLPAISSTVASPAANQLSQQAHQHLATSPHSGPLTNSPPNVHTCTHGIYAAATITTIRLPGLQ